MDRHWVGTQTSGCPSGSRKASGTRLEAVVRSLGLGAAEYSVNGMALPFGIGAGAMLMDCRPWERELE